MDSILLDRRLKWQEISLTLKMKKMLFFFGISFNVARLQIKMFINSK